MKLSRCVATVVFMLMPAPVLACSCMFVAPQVGFGRAEAVFTGKVIHSSKGNWTVAVHRVWKGEVESQIELFDAHAGSSCSTGGYKKGRSYLFLVSIENKNGKVRYSPQPCNWGGALRTRKMTIDEGRITVGEGPRAKWVEELVLTGQGEGKAPLTPSR